MTITDDVGQSVATTGQNAHAASPAMTQSFQTFSLLSIRPVCPVKTLTLTPVFENTWAFDQQARKDNRLKHPLSSSVEKNDLAYLHLFSPTCSEHKGHEKINCWTFREEIYSQGPEIKSEAIFTKAGSSKHLYFRRLFLT